MRILDSLKRIENGQVVVVPSSTSSSTATSSVSKWIVLCLTSLFVMEQFQVCSSFSTVTTTNGQYYGRRYIHTMSDTKRQPRDDIVCHSHTPDKRRKHEEPNVNENISFFRKNKNNWSRQEVFQQCTSILTKSTLLSSSVLFNAPTAAVAAATSTTNGPLMEYMKERVLSPDVSKMANIGGLQVSDIFYPSWFKGVWDVSSKTLDIAAPCGPTLFGGMYQSTVDKEVGQSIQYKARFLSNNNDDTSIIADREYNVQSIVSATMKDGSPIMDVRLATPHLFTCYLGGNAFRVDMLESQRAQSNNNNNMEKEFICSEIVQQIVTSTQQQQQRIKLVETTTIYQYQTDGSILGKQKTFTYLVPSQDDMIALQQWQQAKNRAIDVRTYEVTYKKST